MPVQSLGQENPLEEGVTTHSSILAWRIPWSGEPGSYGPWGHQFSSDSCPVLKALVLVHFAGEN